MKKTPLALALISICQPLYAMQLQPVNVVTDGNESRSEIKMTEDVLQTGNSEQGALLRGFTGVSASRKGGHGLEIQMRGQKQDQLNILMDGAKIEAGCPNRMDPPTSYTEIGSYDEIEVIRGVQSLQHAAGGTGGTVLFKRNQPEYNAKQSVSGEATLKATTFMKYDANAEMKAVGKAGYLVVQGAKKEAEHYQDGNGDEVKSSYETQQGHIDLGWTPNENHHIKLSAENTRTDNAHYPGAMMDAPETEGTMLRLQYEGRHISEAVEKVDFDLYRSEVKHVMNNTDLRTSPKYPSWHAKAGQDMKRETPTETSVIGSKVKLTSQLGKTQIEYGIQTQSTNQVGTLTSTDGAMPMSISHMWPDVTTDINSVFAEAKLPSNKTSQMIVGIRLDQVNAKASKVNDATQMGGNTASKLYSSAYSNYSQEDSAQEDNLSGLLRYEQRLSSGYNWYTGLSHTKRTANATERFMAKNGMKMHAIDKTKNKQNNWIGNPNLNPEAHNQFDFGFGKQAKDFTWQASIWYDQVNDFILRDLATNQQNNGVKASAKDMTEVYVNVDAELYGADVEAVYDLNDNLELGGNLSWTKGRNTTDSRNLAGMSAPSGQVFANYDGHSWYMGSRINFALEQTDLDDSYTAEAKFGKTPAWSTVDIYSGFKLSKSWSVTAGVDNLFDHAYYDHINFGVMGTAYKANEPGRNIWAEVKAAF